jgi:hypothetical protein
VSYVSRVQDDQVHIDDVGDRGKALLREIGARRRQLDRSRWVVQAATDDTVAVVLGRLRDAGVPMAGGRGWPPASVFGHLREAGLLTGAYDEIVWLGGGETRIIAHE